MCLYGKGCQGLALLPLPHLKCLPMNMRFHTHSHTHTIPIHLDATVLMSMAYACPTHHQGLYGSNIASYYRRDPLSLARARPGQFDSLRDSDRQPSSSRFFHAASVMLERNRRLRRLHPLLGRRALRAASECKWDGVCVCS